MISLAADIISPALYPKERLNQLLREITEKNSFDWFGFSSSHRDCLNRSTVYRPCSQAAISRLQPVKSKSFQKPMRRIRYVLKILVSPCDTIIAEEPISPDMLQAFQFSGVNVITIPVDQEGMETSVSGGD